MRPTRSHFAALLLSAGLGLVIVTPGLAAAAPPPAPGAGDLTARPAPDDTVPDLDLRAPTSEPDTPDVTVPDLGLVTPGPVPDVPVISIDDVTLLEGTGGPTGFHFTVSVDHAPEHDPVRVTATPLAVTAETPADWQGIPVDVVIPPGETAQDVVVSVVGDSAIEDDERFLVELSDPVDGEIGDDSGLGTILDDDDAGPSATDELTTATTTTTSTTVTTSTFPTTSGRPSDGAPERTHRALPVTGASIGALGLVGSALVATGTALAARARRLR